MPPRGVRPSGRNSHDEVSDSNGWNQDTALARWFQDARGDQTGHKTAQVIQSQGFADLWYASRLQGEHLRGEALSLLYSRDPSARNEGRFPDPRLPSAYSRMKTCIAAALILSRLHEHYPTLYPQIPAIQPVEATLEQLHWAQEAAAKRDPLRQDHLLAWLELPGRGQPVRLVWTTQTVRYQEREMQMAALLALYCREWVLFTSPAADHDIVTLPDMARNTFIIPLLHHFAWALLTHETEPSCPDTWGCSCNWIRVHLNSRPVSHPRASDALSLETLERAEAARAAGLARVSRFSPVRGAGSAGMGGGNGGTVSGGGVPSGPQLPPMPQPLPQPLPPSLSPAAPSRPLRGAAAPSPRTATAPSLPPVPPTPPATSPAPVRPPSVQEGPGTRELVWPPTPAPVRGGSTPRLPLPGMNPS